MKNRLRTCLSLAAFHVFVVSQPALANDGVTAVAPTGATDFHIVSKYLLLDTCLFTILCDRKIEAGPWGLQNLTNGKRVDGTGYENAWIGPPVGAGGALFQFKNLYLSTTGTNEIVDAYWTSPSGRMPNMVTWYNADGSALPPGAVLYTLVPEPSAWMLFIVGFGVIGLSARRDRIIVSETGPSSSV
jgi:hypothetical protein